MTHATALVIDEAASDSASRFMAYVPANGGEAHLRTLFGLYLGRRLPNEGRVVFYKISAGIVCWHSTEVVSQLIQWR